MGSLGSPAAYQARVGVPSGTFWRMGLGDEATFLERAIVVPEVEDRLELKLIKCHGSANDFLLVDELDGELFSEQQRRILAKAFSDRRGIFGSDGVLFAQSSDLADIRMRMFNPDGSEAQTCGNGLRCVARFASEKLGKSSLTIETQKAISRAERAAAVSPDVVSFSVELGLSTKASEVPLRTGSDTAIGSILAPLSAEIPFTAVSAPNPHLIAVVRAIDYSQLSSLGQRAAALPDLLPERANVSFCSILDANSLAVATYERGAGLTMSCGSAMVSSALTACLLSHAKFGESIVVYNRGGFVRVEISRHDGAYSAWLTGNATFMYSATVQVDLESQILPRSFSGRMNFSEIMEYEPVKESGERVMTRLEQAAQ